MLKVQEFQNLTGTEYVKAAIACCHNKAVEKEQWNTRLAYFEGLDLDDEKTYKKASNPVGLRAAVEALRKTQRGERSGYMISLDAASSGLQFLSLLVEDPLSWKLCGGDENILDAYAEIFLDMNSHLNLERSDVKQSIMTALYGSTATPAAIFGDDVDLFYETMEKMAPGAWDLNLGIQELWDEIDGNTYDWYLPDGFYACIETQDKEGINFRFLDTEYTVIQKVNQRPRFHKGLGPNLIHSVDGMVVREMLRRCMFNPMVTARVTQLITDGANGTTGRSAEKVKELWTLYQESGFLSVRILDYLFDDTIGLVDQTVIANLMMTLPMKPFEVVTVHDCFRCHPNYGNDLRRQYNQILCDIKNSTIMAFIASQVAERPVTSRKVGKISDDVILNANYAIC